MMETYTLPNGIAVFIVPVNHAPVVSVQAWVKRGSIHEPTNLAGISHFLEHSLFKGTKKRKVGQIALEIEEKGGEINAFTSFEETVYYATMASRYVEDALDILADAVTYPSFDKEEMLKEREVILEEIKRAFDSPQRIASMNLWAKAFENTCYGRPVLGYVETVSKMTHQTLSKYFKENYHAGHISLFIVGDVAPEKIKKTIHRLFSKIPKKKPANFSAKVAFNPKGGFVSGSKDIQDAMLHIAWPSPYGVMENLPHVDLFCSALGSGESSRLYQHFVKEKQLALDAHYSLFSTEFCGMSVLSFQSTPEKVEELWRETQVFLKQIIKTGLSISDFERVKSSLESDVVSAKETVEGYARRLGYHYIQYGDPNYEKKYLDLILNTEAADAHEAWAKTMENTPVISLLTPLKHKNIKLKPVKITTAKERKKLAAANQTLVRKQVSGVTLLARPVHHLSLIAVRMMFPLGSYAEKESEYGLSQLFQRTWLSGTKLFSSLQIAKTLESLGAGIHTFSGRHSSGLSLEFLPKHWPLIKTLLSDVLNHPLFPERELSIERDLHLRDIETERDNPVSICQMNLMKLAFPKHPYGRSSLGTKDTVTKLTRSHLTGFLERVLDQSPCIVSSVGQLDPESFSEELLSVLPKQKSNKTIQSVKQPFAVNANISLLSDVKNPLMQAHIMVAFRAPSLHEKERYAFKLLNSALSGQGGSLFLELRDKKSLAYSVSPFYHDLLEGGLFGVYIGCSQEKWAESLIGIRDHIKMVLENPLSKTDVERAKNYWVGRFDLEMQRFATQAAVFAIDEAYGLGHDHALDPERHIRAISAANILTAARKFIQFDRPIISIVHPEKLSDEQILSKWK